MKLDYTNMMASVVKGGIDRIEPSISAYEKVISSLGCGWQEWNNLKSESELDEIIEFCEPIRQKAESVVVLGIGGSALGTLAVSTALLHLRHNELSRNRRGAPKLYIEDNIDPERMNALLGVIDISETMFFVVTKSGETSETLSQFMIVYDLLCKQLGEKAKQHIVAVTTENKGTLFNMAKEEGFPFFNVEKGVGGRFSVFSAVGLLPLCAVGIDIKAFVAGARRAKEYCTDGDIYSNPALMAAYLNIEAYKKGANISVLMPYADSLKYMADFFAQLWGESLGKRLNNSGDTVNVGQTPVKALGVTDQHSQIQLYTEGPKDKVVTFIEVENFREKVTIPDSVGPDFLRGKTLNELINAERKATAFALKKAGTMNMTFSLDEVTPYSVGELISVFMYQTAYAGAMLDIDTYDQPGVEEGKKATFAMLGRKDYEDKLKEIMVDKTEYILERN